RRRGRPPGEPRSRVPGRGGAGRPGGLPVHPRGLRGHQAAPERDRQGFQPARRPGATGGHRDHGALRPARDRPPGRGAVHRPAGPGASQRGDAPHPAGGVVRPGGTPDREGEPARAQAGRVSMRLVFAGTPAVALPALDAIAASDHELVAVVTRPDAVAGRGHRLVRSPVGEWADRRGLEVLTPARPREPEFLDRLRALAPDCVPVVAYGALVPPAALEIPTHGWVNLHFSLLPAWRGAAPVQHAILRGDELTGASVFQLEVELDTGPVFGTVTETIAPTDTAGDLLDRLSRSGARLLVDVLDAIEAGTARAVPQPADGVSYAPKLTAEDA